MANPATKTTAEIYADKFKAERKVESRIELFSLNSIDQVNHTFSASVYANIRMPKEFMASLPDTDAMEKRMDKFSVEFLNLKSSDRDKKWCSVGDTHVEQHIVVVGEWCSPMMLRDFPFDKQELKISFEIWDEENMEQPCVPTPYGESFQKNFMLGEMFTIQEKVDETLEVVGGEGGIPTFTMTCLLSRKTGFYVSNYFAPITCMTTLCFCVLGIDDTETGDRLSTVLTLLLTVVAYKMALSCNLPVMSQMCLLDKYMTGAFMLMFAVTILVSLGDDSRPWVDDTISFLALPWLLFNVYVVYRIFEYKKKRDANASDSDDYEKIN